MRYQEDNEKIVFDIDISINEIRQYFKQNDRGPFFSLFETGLNGCIFDLIRVDPYRRHVRIFEFKSSQQDFTSDKKWQKYLAYCHTFTFVCPRQVIKKSDLPKAIGLMWIYKWRYIDIPNKSWHLSSEWIQKPKKRDVPIETLTDIAFTLIHRIIFFGCKKCPLKLTK